jgi:hypothetical protein
MEPSNLEIPRSDLERAFCRITISQKRHVLVIVMGIIGFLISVISLTSMHIGNNFADIPPGEFFFFETIPFAYWIGIGLLVLSILYVGCLKEQAIRWGVLLSGLLTTSMRIVLNMSLTNFLYYDALVDYAPQITSWLHQGISFIPGTYAHDWPLSFIVAYIFTKAGVPVNIFLEWAAIPIYFIEVYLVYLIASVILNKKDVSLAVLLFGLISLSSEGGLLTLFYNPQIVGGVFFLLSLYLTLKLATKKVTNWKTLSILCVSVFLMILSHHLTVIYFILTLLGIVLLSRIKKSRFLDLDFRIFSFLTIFTSVTWIAYSFIVYQARASDWINSLLSIILAGRQYPDTFNSLGLQSFLKLPLLDSISFVIVPVFIGSLFIINIVKTWRNSSNGLGRSRIFSWLFCDKAAFLTVGMILPLMFICIFGLVFNGLLYPIRIMAVVLFLLCPLGGETLTDLLSSKSKRKRILIILLVIIVTFLGVFWTYRIVQRTVPSLISRLSNQP